GTERISPEMLNGYPPEYANDSRYAGEGLGLYEGAYLYGKGAYRPTENSMMRYNDSPFNAPSRERIYQVIMELSEGEDWVYNYEDFVAYDIVNRNYATSRALTAPSSDSARELWKKKHRVPVIVKGGWKDAK
uniref:M64 family metallopeptidase n=1 Tax=uncultured Bacteroides sp. TaxID=162156 RepID=UPI00261FF755